jgi:hypothetical protein
MLLGFNCYHMEGHLPFTLSKIFCCTKGDYIEIQRRVLLREVIRVTAQFVICTV